MTTAIWVIGLVVIAVIAWFGIKVVVGYSVPPERSGLAYLKQQLKVRGGNITRIPDSALVEIVNQHVLTTRTMSTLGIDSSDKDWRSKLVEYLDMETSMIESIMAGERGRTVKDFVAWKVLVNHGVIKEGD